MSLLVRWRRFAQRSGLGCEECGRPQFAYGSYGPLCRRHAGEDFDRAARAYLAKEYGIEVEETGQHG